MTQQLDNNVLDDLNRPRGGRWVKNAEFSTKGQKIGGVLRNVTIEDRTDDKGNVVKVRGKDKIRQIYRIIFEIPVSARSDEDDDGLRIWDANEPGQSAFRDAVKAAGTTAVIGWDFSARILEEKPDEYSWATYQVKLTPPAKTVELSDTDDDDW